MREAGVQLLPLRKKNSLRPRPPCMTYLQHSIRKIVETTGGLIERLLPKSIPAVTARMLLKNFLISTDHYAAIDLFQIQPCRTPWEGYRSISLKRQPIPGSA